ncbi:unnamed protein product [Mytilus coruscus]|uniref:Uncharacterized protein n=1 Tax=Mytilus coruscus TaxID=42192 RepID=A0A6J8DBS6_MYTCO|nr:unnamed protein product [Mytilus coruscus]
MRSTKDHSYTEDNIKMTSWIKETLHATFVLFTIRKIFTDGSFYVQYTINGNRRICLAYLNCEPGHEIQPCAREYTTDICTSCTNGLVQPDLISSSLKGNHNETNCFAPVSKCDANGKKKYSRSKKTSFCDALRECERGKYLNKTGGCEDCPEGLKKLEKVVDHAEEPSILVSGL